MSRKVRGGKRGAMVTYDQKGQDVRMNLDPSAFRDAGEVMVEETKNAIRDIKTPPSKATLARRRRAGIRSTALFRATGKLIRSLQRVKLKDGWGVRYAADRLENPAVLQRLASEIDLKKIAKEAAASVNATMGKQWRGVDKSRR